MHEKIGKQKIAFCKSACDYLIYTIFFANFHMIINNRIKLKIIEFIHRHCYPCIFNENGENHYVDYIKYIDDINVSIQEILSVNTIDEMQHSLKVLNQKLLNSFLIFRSVPFNFDIFFDYAVNNNTINVQDYFFTHYYKKALYMFKIREKDFNDLKNVAKNYGFKGLLITNKTSKIVCKVSARIKKALEKLTNYLDTTDYRSIGNELLLKLHDDSNLYSGSFNYEDNIFAASGSITLCLSNKKKNLCLFRTLLHEYIHYIDFKIGEKIKKVLYTTQNQSLLFSEFSSYDKSFFPYISLRYADIINHNLNNNKLEKVNILYEKDSLYLKQFLNKEGVGESEFFVKKYAKQFSTFLDFINKVYDTDIQDSVNTTRSIDYFLDSIVKWKSKQFKKHFILIKLSNVLNSDDIKDILEKIGVFDKKSYVRLREKHYSDNVFIREPTLFKRSIARSGMAKYLKRNSETLTWSLTGGLNLYKEYNRKAVKDLYRLMNKDIISLRYERHRQSNNKKEIKDHIIELFNVFSFEYNTFRKIK